jgi:membrane protein DedA with SNARE-associated domain
MLEAIKQWAESVVHSMGYPGVFLLMLLDAVNIPIPSEAIMPTAGILAAQGKLELGWVIFWGSLGSIFGSLISYWIGAALGKPFLLKYGKWLFLSPKEIDKGERWFEKHGIHATLWGRMIPLIRTFISLPAGLFRAPFWLFSVYAVIGSFVWNGIWALIGFRMEQEWESLKPYTKVAEIVVIGLLVALIIRFLAYKRRERLREAANG